MSRSDAYQRHVLGRKHHMMVRQGNVDAPRTDEVVILGEVR